MSGAGTTARLMRPFGTSLELEQRRLVAVRLLADGMSSVDVARRLQVDARSVRRWRVAMRTNSLAGLAARPAPGRPPRLTADDLTCLLGILVAGDRICGAAAGAWTCAEVSDIIEWQFGIRYHRAHVNRILRKLGIEPRKKY